MTRQAAPTDGMGEGLHSPFGPTIVVKPPFVSDIESGVTAVDVALSGRVPVRASGLAACPNNPIAETGHSGQVTTGWSQIDADPVAAHSNGHDVHRSVEHPKVAQR